MSHCCGSPYGGEGVKLGKKKKAESRRDKKTRRAREKVAGAEDIPRSPVWSAVKTQAR